MKFLYIVMRVKTPDSVFEPVIPGARIDYVQNPGDPIGFCPVYETEEDAHKVYPNDMVIKVQVVEAEKPKPRRSNRRTKLSSHQAP